MLKTNNNITGWSKSTLKTYQPCNIEELSTIVRTARLQKTPLYPVSKGLNWGYGSRSPVVENCILVDLSCMNRIINADSISYDHPIAVIEPGVTQIQLYEFLAKKLPKLTFNVTGSSIDTSIIGNALDRGIGYLGPKKNDLFGFEIVTGTGEPFRTGFRRLGNDSPLSQTHPFGLGPILDGLFYQSNFGIVANACLKLLPRQPIEVALSIQTSNNNNFPLLIQELGRLKREGILTSVTHLANHTRSRATLAYGVASYLEHTCGLSKDFVSQETDKVLDAIISDGWTSLSVVSGTKSLVQATLKEIRKRIRKFGQMKIITDSRLTAAYEIAHFLRFLQFFRNHAAILAAIKPLHGLVHSVPTNVGIENLLWKFNHPNMQADELDRSSCGLLFISPALPMDGLFIKKTITEMEAIAKDFGHILYVTVNIETDTSVVAITNLLFNRSNSEETERAHQCADALHNYLYSNKLEVYRARADMMEKITKTNPQYWGKIYALKQIFDPDNIIAPGRYNIY